jgi:hypothetical protein
MSTFGFVLVLGFGLIENALHDARTDKVIAI